MITPFPKLDSEPKAAPVLPAVLPEPKAGGNYLRDPVTGALTLNPDHAEPTPLQE